MPALLTRSRHAVALSTLAIACSTGVVACGEDDKVKTTSSTATVTVTPGVSTGADGTVTLDERGPGVVIASWFSAARRGEAQAKCALETEAYQELQYDSAGQACLDDAANGQPQPAWNESVKIVSLDESGDTATAVVQPNSSNAAEATVVLRKTPDAGWLVASFQ